MKNEMLINQALLSLRAATTGKVRFSIPRPAAEVEAVMLEAYANIVASRGRAFDKEDSTTRQNIHKVAKWLTDPTRRPCLLLQGGVGNGKTTMARCIGATFEALRDAATAYLQEEGWRLNRDGRKPYERLQLLPSMMLLSADEIVSAAGKNNDEYTRIKRQAFICIDDLGVESVTTKFYGTEVTPVADIIYHRYDCQLPTIISTNLGDRDIANRYGTRIADRLQEVCDRLVYNTPSYRSK